MNKQRYLMVVSGPSGCGKDTVVNHLIKHYNNIEVAVSATTRGPRPGEQNGVNYHFVTMEEFEGHIQKGELLEYANYVGNYYGTLKAEVDHRIEKGTTCILVIEVEGAAQIKAMYPECTTVFILPPSMEELARRLRGRGSENEEWVQKRLKRAEEEIAYADGYNFTVVNDDIEKCAGELYDILQKRQVEN